VPCRLEATNSSSFMTGPGGRGNRTNGALPSLKITTKREEEREGWRCVCVCVCVCVFRVSCVVTMYLLMMWLFGCCGGCLLPSFVRSFLTPMVVTCLFVSAYFCQRVDTRYTDYTVNMG
jgi:Flp pilus assembly protein TadB